MKYYFFSFFLMFQYSIGIAQDSNNQSTKNLKNQQIETTSLQLIDDFVQAANQDFLFGNGLNSFIDAPKDDADALQKGFKTQQTDQESKGGWLLLGGKEVSIHNQAFRAILYYYKHQHFIALCQPDKGKQHYFRIYSATQYKDRK